MTLGLITSKISDIETQFNEKKDYLSKITESMRQLKMEEEKTLDSLKELKGSFQSLKEIKDLLELGGEKDAPSVKDKQQKKTVY
jgi:hypothetical protein